MKTEEQLDQALSRLPREIQPPRDLWAGIEAQLEPRQQPWWKRAQPQRWAAVLVVALTGVLWWQLQEEPGQSLLAVWEQQTPEWFAALPAEQQIIASYEQVKAEQLASLTEVSPDVGDWQYQLAIWDQAIDQVRTALVWNPDEPFLLAQMQGLYQQQLDYLQRISSIDADYDVWMEN
ncbi:MAG TPA: hypothetical protein VKZ92_06595 [Pseudohongiella sp.]|nr:hypothetical protein [Pseudohongiella sp.]